MDTRLVETDTVGRKDGLEGVERTRADVAEDHPERGNRESCAAGCQGPSRHFRFVGLPVALSQEPPRLREPEVS